MFADLPLQANALWARSATARASSLAWRRESTIVCKAPLQPQGTPPLLHHGSARKNPSNSHSNYKHFLLALKQLVGWTPLIHQGSPSCGRTLNFAPVPPLDTCSRFCIALENRSSEHPRICLCLSLCLLHPLFGPREGVQQAAGWGPTRYL